MQELCSAANRFVKTAPPVTRPEVDLASVKETSEANFARQVEKAYDCAEAAYCCTAG